MIVSPFEHIVDRFEKARISYDSAKLRWEHAITLAQEADERRRLEEEQRKKQLASTPLVPDSSNNRTASFQYTNVYFIFIRDLGTGSHGRVAEVQEPTSKEYYARKLVPAQPDSRSQAIVEERVRTEVNIMKRLHHPHIAQVLFHVKEKNAFSILMLPVAEYDLRFFLESVCSNESLPTLRQMDPWFGCIVSALAYAHNKNVMHHDLKPANILIKNHQPYLADFGSAYDFSGYESSTDNNSLVAGTPVYFPPEAQPWGRKADVFALGCVFSEMLTVRCGKKSQDYREFRRNKKVNNPYGFHKNLPKVMEWLDGLTSKHRWLDIVLEQTKSMLSEDASSRPDASKVKREFRYEQEYLFCPDCA